MSDGTRSMGVALGVVAVALAAVVGLAAKARGVTDRALKAAQAEADRSLAEKKELADNLNERRRELDALEQSLAVAAGGDDAEVRAALASVKVETRPTPPPTPSSVPPPSFWEGAEQEHRRALLSDTQRRLTQLEKVINEVNGLERRKAEVQAKLAALERLRRTRAGADGGSAP